MRRYVKKIFGLFMAAAMLFTMLPAAVIADDELAADNAAEAYYEQENDQSEEVIEEDTEEEPEDLLQEESEEEPEDDIKEPAQDDEEDSLPLCFSVLFDENGGAGVMDDCEVEADDTFVIPECLFEAPEGMEFDCWEIDGESYQPGDELELTDDIVVMAVWREIDAQQPENSDVPVEKEEQPKDEIDYTDLAVEIEEEFYLDDQDMPYESDELFAAYAQREFDKALYGEISAFGRLAGDHFDAGSANREIYNELKEEIIEIAAGEENSTIIEIDNIDELVWTEEQLGCDIIKNFQISDEAVDAFSQKVKETAEFGRVIRALLADCPYELYWFNKEAGYSVGYSIRFGYEDGMPALYAANIKVKLHVIERYKGEAPFTTDRSVTSAASKAVANAKAWVDENANKSDKAKLDAYRELICDAVSYDFNSPGRAYGDAWQLVNVFDGNPLTNVVCEGYSKAFQYLCDLSEFEGDVWCYSVSGLMQGRDDPEGHMWNVVSIDGENYLADITNCDEGTIGADKKLFLVTGPGKENNKIHTITINASGGSLPVIYTYDEDQADLFCDGYPALYYEDNSALGDVNGGGGVNATDLLQIRQYILKKRTFSDAQLVSADVNKNGSVNATDLLWIRQRILGKRDSNYNLIS